MTQYDTDMAAYYTIADTVKFIRKAMSSGGYSGMANDLYAHINLNLGYLGASSDDIDLFTDVVAAGVSNQSTEFLSLMELLFEEGIDVDPVLRDIDSTIVGWETHSVGLDVAKRFMELLTSIVYQDINLY